MLAWQQIDTVLLDMDGTLIDLHFDNYFWQQLVPEQWGAARGLDLASAQQALAPVFAGVAGTLNWYCLDHWRRELGLDILALKRQIVDKIGWRQNAQAFLQALRASGRRCYLFTYAHPVSLALKMEQTGIDRYLDGLYSTHSFGVPKEEQTCWQALQQALAFDPARTLFIDDSLRILQAARQFGIGHLLGILAPDSQRPAQSLPGFAAIHHYTELLPDLQAAAGNA